MADWVDTFYPMMVEQLWHYNRQRKIAQEIGEQEDRRYIEELKEQTKAAAEELYRHGRLGG